MNRSTLLIAMVCGLFFLCACGNGTGKRTAATLPANADEIAMIGMTHEGGDMGRMDSLKITKDSIHYFLRNADPKFERSVDTTTPLQLWNKLLMLADVNRFKKIKDGASAQPVDGLDEIFFIRTKAG